ncbi:hypothetical protein KC799_25250 [candidate division KSB1 bacterium]|nr:hypothetical protein [candidate division KSB1 bacterium]
MTSSDPIYEKLNSIENRLDNLVGITAQDKNEPREYSRISKGRLKQFTSFISATAASLASITFIVYLLGFIIVNDYLRTFGSREFDLTKPAYLSAGITFTFVILMSVLLPIAFILIMSIRADLIKNKKSDKEWFFSLIFSPIFGLLISMIIINQLTGSRFQNLGSTGMMADFKQFGTFLELIALTIFLVGILIPTLEIMITEPLAKIPEKSLRSFLLGFPPLIISIAFLMLGSWSDDIYPYISSTYGGGEPTVIQIVASNQEAVFLLESSGIKLTNTMLSEPQMMVDENANSILILLEDGNAVRVSKAYIANIIYVSRQNISLATSPPIPLTATVSPFLQP